MFSKNNDDCIQLPEDTTSSHSRQRYYHNLVIVLSETTTGTLLFMMDESGDHLVSVLAHFLCYCMQWLWAKVTLISFE